MLDSITRRSKFVRLETHLALLLSALLILVPVLHTHPLAVSHREAVSSSVAPTDAVSCGLCANSTVDVVQLHLAPASVDDCAAIVVPATVAFDLSSVDFIPSRAPPAA